MSQEIESTRLGSGTYRAVRVGSIGLAVPLTPTRLVADEPALFVPSRWQLSIVRVGQRKLAYPRELPACIFATPGGRALEGRVLHVPRDMALVLGRDPHPKDDAE